MMRKEHKLSGKLVLTTAILIAAGFLIYWILFGMQPAVEYLQATAYLHSDRYEESIALFRKLGSYKDSSDKLNEAYYREAIHFLGIGEYDDAAEIVSLLKENGDEEASRAIKDKIDASVVKMNSSKKGELYNEAMDLYSAGRYREAATIWFALGTYLDSSELAREILYQKANEWFRSGNYTDADALYAEIGDYKNSDDMRDTIAAISSGGTPGSGGASWPDEAEVPTISSLSCLISTRSRSRTS